METQNNYKSNDTITPLITKQINKQLEKDKKDSLIINNKRIENFLIVGKILKFEKFFNRIEFLINDYSGSIILKLIKKFNENNPNLLSHDWKKNGYYKFFCYINIYKGFNFVIFNFEKLFSLNELTFHYTNCIRSSYISKWGFIKSNTEKLDKKIYKLTENKVKPTKFSQQTIMQHFTVQKNKILTNKQQKEEDYYQNIVLNKINQIYKNKKISQFSPSYLFNELNNILGLPNLIKELNILCDEGKLYKKNNLYVIKNPT